MNTDQYLLNFRKFVRIMKRNGFDASMPNEFRIEIKKGPRVKPDPKITFAKILVVSLLILFLGPILGIPFSFRLPLVAITIIIVLFSSNSSLREIDQRNFQSITLKKDKVYLNGHSQEETEFSSEQIIDIELQIPRLDTKMHGNIIFHFKEKDDLNFFSVQADTKAAINEDMENISSFLVEFWNRQLD